MSSQIICLTLSIAFMGFWPEFEAEADVAKFKASACLLKSRSRRSLYAVPVLHSSSDTRSKSGSSEERAFCTAFTTVFHFTAASACFLAFTLSLSLVAFFDPTKAVASAAGAPSGE